MGTLLIGKIEATYEIVFKPIKNTYLRVKYNNHLVITANKRVSLSEIKKFIYKHELKIEKMLSLQPKKELYLEDSLVIFGKTYKVTNEFSKKLRFEIIDDELVVFSKEVRTSTKLIEAYYKEIVKFEALDKVQILQSTLGKIIDLNGIIIKSQLMKSQFGSCHTLKRTVKLNSILGRFDKCYLHAILIHELVHLKEKGHQKKFYDLLLKFEPNYYKLRRELKVLFKQYEV